jgi:hypothetical protein
MSATCTPETAPVPPDSPPKPRKRRAYKAPLKRKLALLADADQRTAAARRAAEIKAGIISDLGGPANSSVAQDALATRAALLAVYCESAEAAWLTTGNTIDESWLQAVSTLQRVLRELGLKRVAKVVDPTEYLKTWADRKAATEGSTQ